MTQQATTPASTWFNEPPTNGIKLCFEVKDTLFEDASDFQKVTLLDTVPYGRMLLLDDLVMTTEKDEFVYHDMITHIPMLAHPAPKNVLVIGGGDGGTVREVLKYPTVERVVLCEIDGMVVDVCRKYLPTIAGELGNPKVDIQIRDGIAYMAEAAQQKNVFDVILIDSTDPIGPGEGLFTEEFYTHVKQALTENGMMVAQTESPVAHQRGFLKIQSLLNKVFPVVTPYFATIQTYPGFMWSWTYCSKEQGPLASINDEQAAQIEQTTQFYNRQIHRSVFAAPNFVRQLLTLNPDDFPQPGQESLSCQT
ncbi:MAG: polyamine aminopropyltransferase [Vampirovibrio sp.]|nr:polyamine aminopropyltransferase [Vampirovibrio sp.]